MTLYLIGASHKTAPLAQRERLVFPPDDLPASLVRLQGREPVEEAMILSTCNRTEVLVEGTDGSVAAVKSFLGEERGFGVEELDLIVYVKEGLEAVRHLFRVGAGLDSMILGEPQILGQLKTAYDAAAGGLGTMMQAVLQRSFAVAKKVRTSTEIGRSPVSVAYAAVNLAEKIFGRLEGRSVLVLGAGETAELALRHLTANGIRSVFVANRTYSRAEAVAQTFQGEAVPYDRFLDCLERVDILVSSTGATEPVLGYEQAGDVIRRRRNRPLFLIDIAVPRDVDPRVNDIDNIYLYDIDDLQNVADAGLEERRVAAEHAERMIEIEVKSYRDWALSREVSPTIVALRTKLHSLGRGEIDRFNGRFRKLPADQQQAVEELASSLINKVLHGPIQHLKKSATSSEGGDRIELVRELFGLEPGGEREMDKETQVDPGDESGSDPDRERR